MSKLIFLAALFSALIVTPTLVHADAAADLTAGREALQQAELDEALKLLVSASEALPESVEAQLALAECYIRLGQVDKALTQYAAVVELSPDHGHAKRMVATLTGQRASFEKRIEAARALIAVAGYQKAGDLLTHTIAQSIEPEQRIQARLLLAEARLLTIDPQSAKTEALLLIEDSEDAAVISRARVIAALALLTQKDQQVETAARLIQEAGKLDGLWGQRAAIATALIQLDDSSTAVATSKLLVDSIGGLPASPLRTTVVGRASHRLILNAEARLRQGDPSSALSIVWPFVSSQAVPAAASVLKPLAIEGGWLSNHEDQSPHQRLVGVLASIGKTEFDRERREASLLGYWLAAEVLRNLPSDKRDTSVESLPMVALLAALSSPADDRKPGDLLSPADQIQRAMILSLAGSGITDKQRTLLAGYLLAQVDRYSAVGDLETGLAQFVTVDAAADPPQIQLVGAISQTPPGAAHQILLTGLAQRYSRRGLAIFQESATSVVKNVAPPVNQFDAVSLMLFGQVAKLYPTDKNVPAVIEKVINRFAAAGQWDQARQAVTYAHATSPDTARLSIISLRIRQATQLEDQLLAARRAIGKELSPLVIQALTDATAMLQQNPRPTVRQSVTSVAGSLIDRYVGLDRPDLVESVIATTVGEAGETLADWAIWMRANLLERRAATALAAVVSQTEDPAKVPLNESHIAEIALLNQLVTDHTRSEFADDAVDRVGRIATVYQNYRAFDTAQAVLDGFLKGQPNLKAAEGIEFRTVQVALSRARMAFDERTDKTKVPEALSGEYATAIDALAVFLKAHPVGDYSATAEDQLFAIASIYGTAGAWDVTREVLNRFTAAIPDFRSAGHLKWLQAVTYVGELDAAYGLKLLTPTPQLKPRLPATGSAIVTRKGGAKIIILDALSGGGAGLGGGLARAERLSASGKELPEQAAAVGQAGGSKIKKLPGGLDPTVNLLPSATPSASSLAMIRQSQQRQYQRIALLEDAGQNDADVDDVEERDVDAVELLPGMVLSAAELKRQDDAADKAYAILIELVKSKAPEDALSVQPARMQILWLFGFFENQLRGDRAIALINRYLEDNPTDSQRVALAYRSVTDKLVWVRQRKPNEKIDQVWINARHQLFEEARQEIAGFITANSDKTTWVNAAQLLAVDSYQQEAQLAGTISAERAGGLLVQAAEAVMDLLEMAPGHPETPNFPGLVWELADKIAALGQNTQAVYVHRQVTLKFPTDQLANKSLLRIAQLYTASLSNPLRAVETFQEYLSRTDGDASVPTAIFAIAKQLGDQKRYLEALHVYGVFVDSFPTDPRAADAVHAIGRTHQSNGAWEEAIASYERIFEEFPAGKVIPQVKLDVAECRINLGEWLAANSQYEEYLEQFPKHDQVAIAQSRLLVLKRLARFQDLLEDNEIDRNKDDAQYQIGRTVLVDLQNSIKAVEEFRKVVATFPQSDVADDAQLEIGKALLALNRLDEGRAELLKLPSTYQNSPLADDALFLVGRSYEAQGQLLAGFTAEKAYQSSFVKNQALAFNQFNKDAALEQARSAQLRVQLKEEGDERKLALNEAQFASRQGSVALDALTCAVLSAEHQTETETALQIANRQDRINDTYREAIEMYAKAASDYPLGDKTDQSLLRIADIFETQLKDRAAAMETYQRIVKLFPGTPVAEDAAWKVAQFYVEEAKYTDAADAYKTFIRNYPGSDRVAEAQFGMAEVLEQLGRWVDAMDAYEVFRQKFNKHPKVALAAEQISWIKTYRK